MKRREASLQRPDVGIILPSCRNNERKERGPRERRLMQQRDVSDCCQRQAASNVSVFFFLLLLFLFDGVALLLSAGDVVVCSFHFRRLGLARLPWRNDFVGEPRERGGSATGSSIRKCACLQTMISAFIGGSPWPCVVRLYFFFLLLSWGWIVLAFLKRGQPTLPVRSRLMVCVCHVTTEICLAVTS